MKTNNDPPDTAPPTAHIAPRLHWQALLILIAFLILIIFLVLFSRTNGRDRDLQKTIASQSQAAPDPNLILLNALSYHFYTLKNDPGAYEQIRSNLANIAMSAEIDPSVAAFHEELMQLCRQCELFYVQRKDLQDLRQARRKEMFKQAASKTGGLAVGSAVRSALFDANTFSLAVSGAFAVANGVGYAFDSAQANTEYEQSIAMARSGLGDVIARTEHSLTNLRAQRMKQPNSALIFAEDDFRTYTAGLARLAVGDKEAIPLLKQIVPLPGMTEAWFYLALAYESDSQPQNARQAYEQVLAMHSLELQYSNALLSETRLRLAQLAARQDQWAEAAKHLQTAIEQDGETVAHLCLLGQAQLNMKQHEQAVATFRKALQLDANSAFAAYGLAQALSASGKKDEAMQWLESARKSGTLDLATAAKDPFFGNLQELPHFQSLIKLNMEAIVDWGPFSEEVILTNRNTFPITAASIQVKRKNRDEDEKSESLKVAELASGDSVKIGGAIGKGPKSRTEYFSITMRCNQGQWSQMIQIGPKNSGDNGAKP